MVGTLLAKCKKIYQHLVELMEERAHDRLHDGDVTRTQAVAHLAVMAVKGFLRNKCLVRATALSYTTLLALVPLLAVAVSVTTNLLQGSDKASTELIDRLVRVAAPQLKLFSQTEAGGETVDAHKQVVEQIHRFIENFQSKTVGGSGLVGVILVALLLLSTIERTFNDIWGVARGRAWLQRLVKYWTTISLGPVIIVMAFVLTQGIVSSALLDFLGFIVISLGFALLYKLMPNTHVQWRAALLAGTVSGCLWLVLNLSNAANLGRVIGMSKIYGSLAIPLIFLIGLYFSWLIVLFGAQVSYTIQNSKIYLQERRARAVSQSGREFLALRIMTRVAERFNRGAKRPTLLELSEHLSASSRLVALVLRPLTEAQLIVEVSDPEISYVPGRPIEDITCHDILMALRRGRGTDPEIAENAEGELVLDAFHRIQTSEKEVARAVTLKELAERSAKVPGDKIHPLIGNPNPIPHPHDRRRPKGN